MSIQAILTNEDHISIPVNLDSLDKSKILTKGDLANAIATSAFLSEYIAGIFGVKPEKSCVRVKDEAGNIFNTRTTLIRLVIAAKDTIGKPLHQCDKYVQCSLFYKAKINVRFNFDFDGWNNQISENFYEDAKEIIKLAKDGKLTTNKSCKFPIFLDTVYEDGKANVNHLEDPSWNPSNLLSMVEISKPTSNPQLIITKTTKNLTLDFIEKMIRDNNLEDYLSTADSYVKDIKVGSQIEKAISHIIRSCLNDRFIALNKILVDEKSTNLANEFSENWEKYLITHLSQNFKREDFIKTTEIPEFTFVEKDGVELLDLKDRNLCWIKIHKKYGKFILLKDMSFSISHLAEAFKIDFKKLKDHIASIVENFFELGKTWSHESKILKEIPNSAFVSIISLISNNNENIHSLSEFYKEMKNYYETSISCFNDLKVNYSPNEILRRYISGTMIDFDVNLKEYYESYAKPSEKAILDRASISKSIVEALEDSEIKEFFERISNTILENIPYFGTNGNKIDEWDSIVTVNEYLRLFTDFLREKIDVDEE